MSSSAITGPVLADTRRAPSGTAAAPSFAFNDSTGTGVYLVSAGVLGISTAGVQRVVVDASGNVGIGTSTPQARLDLGNASGERLRLYSSARIGFGVDMGGTFGNSAFTNHSFNWGLWDGTTWTERMRIDSGGNLLVGKTSANVSVTGVELRVSGEGIFSSANTNNINFYNTTAGAYRFFVSAAGQINATSTSITAISDISLKENVRDLETGLSQVLALKPRRFDWKAETLIDEKNVAGFIAQEVEEILPELVYDYKYNEDVTKKALKMGDMVPTLVKAIQEQQEIIGKLEARLAALEAK